MLQLYFTRRLSYFCSTNSQIIKIENLGHLTELRVLNLAGNEIVHVCNVSGMRALAELNLRRNKICTVVCVSYSFLFLSRKLHGIYMSTVVLRIFCVSKMVVITYCQLPWNLLSFFLFEVLS